MIIDTHVHLNDEAYNNCLDEVIEDLCKQNNAYQNNECNRHLNNRKYIHKQVLLNVF